MRDFVKCATYALMGAAVGAAIAYRTSPASGSENRRRLGRRLDDEADDLRRMGQRAARQATDYLEDQLKQGKKKLNEVVSR